MLIRPVSDLHCEFSTYILPELDTDRDSVLVLAGDIGVAKRLEGTIVPFLDSVTERFRDILYIPGNHEFYNGSLVRVDDKLGKLCKRYDNVHYLNHRAMDLDGVRFIGATLWTDVQRGDPVTMMHIEDVMSDYGVIRTGTAAEPYRRRIKPHDTTRLNENHRNFLRTELEDAAEKGLKVVVFTHHAPSFISRSDAYPATKADYAYYNTGMDDLILDYKPRYWIHGHSHQKVRVDYDGTDIVANCRGYSHDPNGWEDAAEFDPCLVLEV